MQYVIKAIVSFSGATFNLTSLSASVMNTTVEVSIDVVTATHGGQSGANAAANNIAIALSHTTDETGMFFIGDPFSLEVYLTTAILLGPCATAGDHTMARFAKYANLSPFTDLGAETVALIHGLVAMLLVALHTSATGLYYKQLKPVTFLKAAATMRFPSVSGAAALLLFPGTVFAVMELIFDGVTGDGGFHVSAGLVVGLLHTIFVIIGTTAILVIAAKTDKNNNRYTLAITPSSKTLARTLFRPEGVWESDTSLAFFGTRHLVKGNSAARGLAFMLLSVMLTVVVFAVLFVTNTSCNERVFVSSALVLISAILIAVARPFLTLFSNLMTIAALVGVSLLLLIHGIALATDISTAEGGGSMWIIKLIALIIVFVSTIARTLHTLVLLWSKPPRTQGSKTILGDDDDKIMNAASKGVFGADDDDDEGDFMMRSDPQDKYNLLDEMHEMDSSHEDADVLKAEQDTRSSPRRYLARVAAAAAASTFSSEEEDPVEIEEDGKENVKVASKSPLLVSKASSSRFATPLALAPNSSIVGIPPEGKSADNNEHCDYSRALEKDLAAAQTDSEYYSEADEATKNPQNLHHNLVVNDEDGCVLVTPALPSVPKNAREAPNVVHGDDEDHDSEGDLFVGGPAHHQTEDEAEEGNAGQDFFDSSDERAADNDREDAAKGPHRSSRRALDEQNRLLDSSLSDTTVSNSYKTSDNEDADDEEHQRQEDYGTDETGESNAAREARTTLEELNYF